MSVQREEILIAEIRTLLAADSTSKAEAALAGRYVRHPEAQRTIEEQIAGTPAGEIVHAIGPILLPWLSGVAAAFLVELQKEGVKAAAKEAVAWLKKSLSPKPIAVSDKETVIKAIEQELLTARLPADSARRLAEETWERGQQAAKKLAN